ncbi:MAG: methylated-DNA--[protein]-cysteine S-methyltransferase [Bacteroides sp.]|nr:methylated-DNA--[protein]-cysteine S-methyltransferase [Bacteroides sp.]MBD5371554.1 methylated-DNA--[protein]-cysteine S-methyltransferase [Bacteroides sp.]
MNRISIRKYPSECGVLVLGAFRGRLCLCDWKASERYRREAERLARALDAEIVETEATEEGCAGAEAEILEQAAQELDRYFAGKCVRFETPLLLTGTDFQIQVREALREIGYGKTASYAEIAKRAGHPAAVRAVANAIAGNPISIFLPCHRVVGSDGSITGYRGGIEAKFFLLNLESQSTD